MKRLFLLTFTFLLFAWPSAVLMAGQAGFTARDREQLGSVPKGLPGDISLQIRGVGVRLRATGKEETVLEGQLSVGNNAKQVRIVHQLSGMVRIEGIRAGAVTFDGEAALGVAGRTEEALLEAFVMDSIEGLLYSARSGGAVRLLGRRFGPDPRKVSNYRGPRYDIFEVVSPVRSRRNQSLQARRYYFDSDTGLPESTRYTDSTVSPAANVETRFSNWRQADGSFYPGRIDRYENGGLVFSFIVATASGRPRTDAANFR